MLFKDSCKARVKGGITDVLHRIIQVAMQERR